MCVWGSRDMCCYMVVEMIVAMVVAMVVVATGGISNVHGTLTVT